MASMPPGLVAHVDELLTRRYAEGWSAAEIESCAVSRGGGTALATYHLRATVRLQAGVSSTVPVAQDELSQLVQAVPHAGYAVTIDLFPDGCSASMLGSAGTDRWHAVGIGRAKSPERAIRKAWTAIENGLKSYPVTARVLAMFEAVGADRLTVTG